LGLKAGLELVIVQNNNWGAGLPEEGAASIIEKEAEKE
jgi:hypothetical protein